MPIEHINKTDTLNEGRVKLNNAITAFNEPVTFDKRTRLGDIATITLSSTSDLPNIDTTDRQLIFPATFFIVDGKRRYTIDNGAVVEFTHALGNFIYFDTETESLVCVAQTGYTGQVEESYILLASIFFSADGRLLGANMSCPYLVDGNSYINYFIEELDRDKIPLITSMPLITVGIEAPLPNYNSSSGVLYFESMNIFLRNNRIYINNPVELDFGQFDSGGIVVYFDTLTNDFYFRSQTAMSNITNSSIVIAVLYRYTQGGARHENIIINTEYTIDGKSRYGDLIDKPYAFNVDVLVKDFPDMDLPGVGDPDSPFDYDNDDHELVYGLFDNLIQSNPNYITKTKLEETDIGTPINEYFFNPERSPEVGTTGFMKPYPKFIIGASVHGGEGLGVAVLYYLMEQICNGENEVFEYLRNNVRLAICPLRSPDDYDRKSYVNHNGVNINRNFDYEWESRQDDTKGPYPFSEVEARAQRDWMFNHQDALHHIDIHVRGGRQRVDDDAMIDIRYEGSHDIQPAENMVMKLSRRWQKRHSELPKHPLGYVRSGSSAGTIVGYSRKIVGIPTYTWEGFSRSTTMNEVENRDIVNMNVEFLGQTLVNLIKYHQK